MAWYYDNYKGDLQEAARFHQKAVELAPNDVQVMNGFANFLLSLGRYEESITLFSVLVKRDPVNSKLHYNMGLAYIFARRFDEASESFDRALALSPDNELGGYFRAFTDFLRGQCGSFVEKTEALSTATGNDVYRLIGHSLCYPGMDREAEAAQALESLEDEFGDRYTTWVAAVHARQGRADDAFEWLERAYRMNGPGQMLGVPHGVMFESLHDDPRWEPLLEKLGLAPGQLAAIEFDVELPR
ncbi:MAG: tetratricopeptide repeat protein [Gammaproteobacteria bacterium]